MDIQRGDQVYYRGEVWTVGYITPDHYGKQEVLMWKTEPTDADVQQWAFMDQLQRVEQVR